MSKQEVLDPEILNSIESFSEVPVTQPENVLNNGNALQQVKTAYTTAVAVQKPRSIARVTKNVLEEAKLAGTAFFYRWDVKTKGGKKEVIGPSIDLTMCIARNYGNCVVDIEGTETPTHYMLKGVFIDLETGFTVPRLYRQRKNQNIGNKYGDERAEDIVFQIAQSKAQRNAIAKAIPNWLIDRAIEEARQAEIKGITSENLSLARSKVITFFETYGITEDRIEKQLNRKVDLWTAEDIVNLRASATAVKEGRISADELFPDVEIKESEKSKKETVKKPKEETQKDLEEKSMADVMKKLNAIPDEIRVKAAKELKCAISPISIGGKSNLLNKCYELMNKK